MIATTITLISILTRMNSFLMLCKYVIWDEFAAKFLYKNYYIFRIYDYV